MTTRPLSVTATWFLIGMNALVWLVFGVIVAMNAHPALPNQPLVKGGMAFLSFVVAGVLIGLIFLLARRSRLAYFSSLGLFLVITFLTITDQFGWSDFVILVINLTPMILLLKDRRWYLRVLSPQRRNGSCAEN